ncbi:MAG: CinA family protein [Anaerolineales bacterium]|jgi:PncC family amidohydrolase
MPKPLEVRLGELFEGSELWLAVTESSTGGLLGHLITNVPGSSTYFRGGVIAYANEVKADVLGVSSQTLDTFGAVSKETVIEMARGVRRVLDSDIGVAISGIAGPGGGTDEKPVGTTVIGMSALEKETSKLFVFTGDRLDIKTQAARAAMQLVIDFLEEQHT